MLIINNPNIFIHKEFTDEKLFNWMDTQNVDLIGKIKDQDGFIGIMAIKLKSFKDGLTPNELHLLNTILNQKTKDSSLI